MWIVRVCQGHACHWWIVGNLMDDMVYSTTCVEKIDKPTKLTMVFKKIKKKRGNGNWHLTSKDEVETLEDSAPKNISLDVEPRQTRLRARLTSTPDDRTSKRKKVDTPKKIIDKIIIDDDAPLSTITAKAKTTFKKLYNSVETLFMECGNEELEPIQKEIECKSDTEYSDLLKKLEELAKKNDGGVVHKGEHLMAYQFTADNLQSLQLNGINNDAFITKPVLTTPVPTSSVIMTQKPGATPQTYQLVMDPRLGLIVGTMTPTNQKQTNITTTQATPPPPPLRPALARRTRGRPMGPKTISSPQPVSLLNNTPPPPPPLQALPAPPPTTNIVSHLRPAESTAVGGIVTGTIGAKQQPTAIVDLTEDDGRPPADSREVSFNKLQGKTFPSLVVVARPHLHAKEAMSTNDRQKLDEKVKSVLVHTPTKFTEWLIQQGLVRSEQYCSLHPNTKLNLGMYSDVSKFPYSGGYVWISECCPHRFVSVFSGSIFEGASHPPSILLKLIYHWSCQTNIQNVTQWVKVDNLYAKGLFTWLRAACSFALGQHIKTMGGPEKTIEVGVISLGTTSQDGSQRQVKVEVLGILDPELKLIRLRAVEPLTEGERNYKRRFSKILEPLRTWVETDSIIATDLTVDKGTLHMMGFTNIVQNSQSGSPANQGVMEYLRKIVPRMFQNTLSLLSRQIIQQFLDELVWREWYGQTPAQAFDSMVKHLAEQTRLNIGDSLLQRLNKVAANPFKNHAFPYIMTQTQQTNSLDAKRYTRKRTAGGPLDFDRPVKKIQISEPTSLASSVAEGSADSMVPLESYYYGTMEGEATNLSQRVVLNVRCCVCKVPHSNNIELLNHLLAHAHNLPGKSSMTQCRYCLASSPSVEDLNKHIAEMHPIETKLSGRSPACIVCEQKFTSIYTLGKHLSKEHVPQELPYQCGTCGFRSSSHRHAVDHFYNAHNGAATLQCPFCLKSTAVWSSGRIMSTNVTFFLAHLQKHQKKSMAKKCYKCALWFIQKDSLKEHQQKAHVSMMAKRGVKPWSTASSYMVPRSKIFPKSNNSLLFSPSLLITQPEPEISSYKLTLLIPPNSKCKECSKMIISSEHFPQKISCSQCRYVSDCVHAMHLHKMKCRKSSLGTIQPNPLSTELYCTCGYSSKCGNKIAKHLALCERKTAYPTLELAKAAINNNQHSMLDVLGLMRRSDDSNAEEEENVDSPIAIEDDREGDEIELDNESIGKSTSNKTSDNEADKSKEIETDGNQSKNNESEKNEFDKIEEELERMETDEVVMEVIKDSTALLTKTNEKDTNVVQGTEAENSTAEETRMDVDISTETAIEKNIENATVESTDKNAQTDQIEAEDENMDKN